MHLCVDGICLGRGAMCRVQLTVGAVSAYIHVAIVHMHHTKCANCGEAHGARTDACTVKREARQGMEVTTSSAPGERVRGLRGARTRGNSRPGGRGRRGGGPRRGSSPVRRAWRLRFGVGGRGEDQSVFCLLFFLSFSCVWRTWGEGD